MTKIMVFSDFRKTKIKKPTTKMESHEYADSVPVVAVMERKISCS